MATWTGEEIFEGVERWLKTRRDECKSGADINSTEYLTIDGLLDELRDTAVEGWFPWQRINHGE